MNPALHDRSEAISLDIKRMNTAWRGFLRGSRASGLWSFPVKNVPGLARTLPGALLAVTALLLAPAPPAFGFFLGDLEIRSALGQPLRVWIPYRLAKDDVIDATWIHLSPGKPVTPPDIPTILNARPRLQSQDGNDYIVLETSQAINDPAACLVIDEQCGPSVAVTREFVLLLDPLRHSAEPALRAPAAASGAGSVGAAQATKPPSGVPDGSPPKTAVATPTQPPQQANKGKPVLRLERADKEENVPGGAGNLCCLRLTYELTDRSAPPPTEDERARLRQEMHDRISDEDPVTRLQALRSELAMLKRQLTASAKELEDVRARDEQRARQARVVREYALYSIYILVALALTVALWQWSRMKRRRERLKSSGVRSTVQVKPKAAAAVAPVEPISILGPEIFHTARAVDTARRGAIAPLDVDLSKK